MFNNLCESFNTVILNKMSKPIINASNHSYYVDEKNSNEERHYREENEDLSLKIKKLEEAKMGSGQCSAQWSK